MTAPEAHGQDVREGSRTAPAHRRAARLPTAVPISIERGSVLHRSTFRPNSLECGVLAMRRSSRYHQADVGQRVRESAGDLRRHLRRSPACTACTVPARRAPPTCGDAAPRARVVLTTHRCRTIPAPVVQTERLVRCTSCGATPQTPPAASSLSEILPATSLDTGPPPAWSSRARPRALTGLSLRCAGPPGSEPLPAGCELRSPWRPPPTRRPATRVRRRRGAPTAGCVARTRRGTVRR